MPTCPRGYRFQALAQLVNFDGEAGEGQRLTAADAVVLDQSAQLGMTVEGGPAESSAGGDRRERDGLAGADQLHANLLDLLDQVAFSHDAWFWVIRRSSCSIRRR